MGDVLFSVRNLFYLGSYQGAINEAQDIEGLSDTESVERDVFVYRSYIALGSAQVRRLAPKIEKRMLASCSSERLTELSGCAAGGERNLRVSSTGAHGSAALCRVHQQEQKQGAHAYGVGFRSVCTVHILYVIALAAAMLRDATEHRARGAR